MDARILATRGITGDGLAIATAGRFWGCGMFVIPRLSGYPGQRKYIASPGNRKYATHPGQRPYTGEPS